MINTVITIKLKELLDSQNKSLYRLQKETDISYNALMKIQNNEVSSMSFEVLEKLCDNLKCMPNDILEYTKSGD